jgi:competence protein ComEA
MTFSKGQRNALIAIAVAVLAIILCKFILPYIRSKELRSSYEFLKKSDLLENLLKKANSDHGTYGIFDAQNEDVTVENLDMFYFDPNKTSMEDWKKLGVSEKVIRTIEKYLSKGGKFRRKEDLKKIWGLTTETYNRISPFVVISDSNSTELLSQKNRGKKEIVLIDLNMADTSELLSLNGIGPIFASRIIKYRKLLGGFTDPNQLLEVFGIDSLLFTKLKGHVFIEEHFSPIHITLNTSDFSELAKHPYIGKNLAKKIIQSRSKDGPFKEIKVLQERKLVERKDSFDKLIPYLILWPESP